MVGDAAPKGHILMTVGQTLADKKVGWNSYDPMGSVDRVPSWNIYGYTCVLDSLESRNAGSYTTCYLSSNFQETFLDRFHLTISVDGISRDFEFSSASYPDGIYMFDAFNLQSKVGQTLAVIFDPPPRRLRTSKDITFDLEYYVEREDPWEDQNAEQRSSVMQ
jgi:hypothetical protein